VNGGGALPGWFGSVNRRAGSAGLAGWGRVLHEQLMNTLVGDAEDRAGVAHADPAAGESDSCFAGLLDGQAVGVAGLFSGFSGLFDGSARGFWQYRSGDELDQGFVSLVPQGGCFARTGELGR
jgi:hypothetical protein